MSLKELIKQVLPRSLNIFLRKNKIRVHIINSGISDMRLYMKNASLHEVGDNETALNARLIFFSHSIEKGLSHPNFRSNFGRGALIGLKSNLDKYLNLNLSKNSMAYQNAISVLKAYKMKHEELKASTDFFDDLFPAEVYFEASDIAGSKNLAKEDFNYNTFTDIATNRRSVREFSDDPVDLTKIEDSVKLAINTPSVCNRQPWKVYSTDNSTLIKKLLDIQGGYTGYSIPPVLSLISVDLKNFFGSGERNEAYVDGGFFTMSYLYALSEKGLVSCTLNMMLAQDKLAKIRQLLNVSDSEILIAFVIIGNCPENYNVAKSHRKSLNDIYTYVE